MYQLGNVKEYSTAQHKYSFKNPHRNFVYGFEDILLRTIEYYLKNWGILQMVLPEINILQESL